MAQAQSGINQPAQAFFSQLLDGYHQAALCSGSAVQFHYQIGGKRIRIGYASQECAQVFAPALHHLHCSSLPTAGPEPDFTIWVWDCVSTGASPFATPWTFANYLPNRMVRGFCDERFRTIAYHDSAVCLMIDQETRQGIYWRRNIQETPAYESAAPFQELFCWWMARHKIYFVHGGAIDGVFIAGVSGAGKSTTVLACLAQGMAWAGEDYVLLAEEQPICVHSLYCAAKLSEFSLRLLPEYRACITIPPTEQSEKSVLNLYPRYAQWLVSHVKMRAAVLPVIRQEKQSRLIPVSASVIFRPLFSSTLMHIPSADSFMLHGIANVLRRLPCYQLEIGENLEQLVDCLRMLGTKP